MGRAVGEVTLRRLVEEPTRSALPSLAGYSFCASPECEVAYYADDGGSVAKGQVTVRIGLKETAAPRPLCYCFDVSAEDIEAELEARGATTLPEMIASRCRQGLDRCPETNPRGACCLGDVRRIARAAGAKDLTDSAPGCCTGASTAEDKVPPA